jgi:hypothetical protein
LIYFAWAVTLKSMVQGANKLAQSKSVDSKIPKVPEVLIQIVGSQAPPAKGNNGLRTTTFTWVYGQFQASPV